MYVTQVVNRGHWVICLRKIILRKDSERNKSTIYLLFNLMKLNKKKLMIVLFLLFAMLILFSVINGLS